MTDPYQRFQAIRTPLDDKDHVFARFKSDKSVSADRRETVTVARRGSAPGSRIVEVVHVRSGAGLKARSQRINTHVRAAPWDRGSTARHAAPAPSPTDPMAAAPTNPTNQATSAVEAVAVDAGPARSIEGAGQRVRGHRPNPVGIPSAINAGDSPFD